MSKDTYSSGQMPREEKSRKSANGITIKACSPTCDVDYHVEIPGAVYNLWKGRIREMIRTADASTWEDYTDTINPDAKTRAFLLCKTRFNWRNFSYNWKILLAEFRGDVEFIQNLADETGVALPPFPPLEPRPAEEEPEVDVDVDDEPYKEQLDRLLERKVAQKTL